MHVYYGEVDFVKYTTLLRILYFYGRLRKCKLLCGNVYWVLTFGGKLTHRIAQQIIKAEILKRHKGLLKFKDVRASTRAPLQLM